jgi:DNA-binding NtrC family response regulator/tetratricopeptide (TPR) repeat protein
MQAGNPQVMTALHIYLAETEAKRGLLNNARRHLAIGKRGLSGFSNRWLEALAENVESAIETMNSDFDAAIAHAEKCLALSAEAGARSVHESALGNLANLSVISAQLDQAVNCLERAQASRKGSDNWTACAETLARIYLAQDRLSDCETILEHIDDAVTEANRSCYAYRHTQLTKVQLFARLNKLDEALRHLDVVHKLADQSGDVLLGDLAVLERAELLREVGEVDQSVLLLRSLISAIPNRSPDFLGHYERSLACSLILAGDVEAAEHHRARAERIYLALKNKAGQLELARCWARATAHRPQPFELRASPVRVVISTILGDVASIFLHADRYDLIAREVLNLLTATDCVIGATALARTSNGTLEALGQIGQPPDTSSPDLYRLVVGTQGDRSVEIVASPKPGLESLATLNSLLLLLATARDLEGARLEREERATLWPVDELPISNDGAVTVGHMRDTMALAKKVANANVSVLVTGESGTGKEVVARAIHAHSSRAHKPFIPFNCTAVPRELLESQLFGYRRGAFTGADRDHPGIIRSARDGTLFLDEIGEMSLELQPKLLRFLESGEICPLGEASPFVVNVRVVAATNSRLEVLVKEGRFREDLFYRLNVIRLSLKPLRDRRDEIPTLINYFLIRASEEFGKSHVRLTEETMERLALYSWPGNVRQLQNEIRRLVALAESGSLLRPQALSADILTQTVGLGSQDSMGSTPPEPDQSTTVKLNPALSRIEREMIKCALREHGGKMEAAAKALGISRKGLYLKRQRLGL